MQFHGPWCSGKNRSHSTHGSTNGETPARKASPSFEPFFPSSVKKTNTSPKDQAALSLRIGSPTTGTPLLHVSGQIASGCTSLAHPSLIRQATSDHKPKDPFNWNFSIPLLFSSRRTSGPPRRSLNTLLLRKHFKDLAKPPPNFERKTPQTSTMLELIVSERIWKPGATQPFRSVVA